MNSKYTVFKNRTHKITARLTFSEKNMVLRNAKLNDLSTSQFIRRACILYIAELKKKGGK